MFTAHMNITESIMDQAQIWLNIKVFCCFIFLGQFHFIPPFFLFFYLYFILTKKTINLILNGNLWRKLSFDFSFFNIFPSMVCLLRLVSTLHIRRLNFLLLLIITYFFVLVGNNSWEMDIEWKIHWRWQIFYNTT